MSSVAIPIADVRIRLSDPKPALCSACYRGADETVRFVDFDAAFDAGVLQDPSSLQPVLGSDDLHLCESCVKRAGEVLRFKPELHARQLANIKQLEDERDELKARLRVQDELIGLLKKGEGS